MPDLDLADATVERMAKELGSHVDHFFAWFDEDGKKVRHEDIGGIQCICGWNHPPTEGYRPWDEFNVHRLRAAFDAGKGETDA